MSRPRPAPVAAGLPNRRRANRSGRACCAMDSANASAKAHQFLLAQSSVANREETEVRSGSKDPRTHLKPSGAHILSQRVRTYSFRQDILLLCAVWNLTLVLGRLVRTQDRRGPNRTLPSVWPFTIFDDPSWDAMCPNVRFRYWRLIEIPHQPGGQPLNTSSLRADERSSIYLKSLNYLETVSRRCLLRPNCMKKPKCRHPA